MELLAIKSIYKLKIDLGYFGVSLMACFMCQPAFASPSDESIKKHGDFLTVAIPLTALGATWYYDDLEGTKQFAYSAVTTGATIVSMKRIVGKLRPAPTSSNLSFPSGHSAGGFAGAAFLYTRYGKAWGIPAYFLATYTAYTRVHADAHHVDDVMAGASFALFSNWFWVTPHSSNIRVGPMIDSKNDGYGVAINITEKSASYSPGSHRDTKKTKFRYEMIFGPAYLDKNEFRAPSDTGTTFDLADFELTNDPTTTANVVFSWNFSDPQKLAFSLAPFEARDYGQFKQDTLFNKTIFSANTEILSAYRMYDFRVQYSYDIETTRNWHFQLGGALAIQKTVLSLQDTQSGVSDEVNDWAFLPLLYAGTNYSFFKKWSVNFDVSGISLSQDKHLDLGLMVNYKFNNNWDAGTGYRYFSRDIETSELHNKVIYNIWALSLAYSF